MEYKNISKGKSFKTNLGGNNFEKATFNRW